MNYRLLLNTILRYKKQGIIVVDNKANIIYLNEINGDIFETDPKYAIGKNILDIFYGMTKEESALYLVLQNETALINNIQTFYTLKGNRVTSITTTVPLYNEKNELVGAVEIFENINDYKKLSNRIIELQKKEHVKKIVSADYKSNGTKYTLTDIIGNSNPIKELKKKIYKIADSSSPVLIYGETGTGKELVSQSIHNASFKRRTKPFIAQNCAAIPRNLLESILFGTTSGSFTGSKEKPGLFELADKGTLLLDEINSMDIDLQAKLLRVLQDGRIRRVGSEKTTLIDVRIITSTNISPLEAVEKGLIRKDLFYRLNVISLNVLPLRERKEDIKVLIDHFIKIYNAILGKQVNNISEKSVEKLLIYNWPGNVRELKSTLENIMNFVEGNMIKIDDLPQRIKLYNTNITTDNHEPLNDLVDSDEILPLKDVIEKMEKTMIVNALTKTKGNKSKTARLLNIPRQSLNNKIKKYNIVENYKAN